MLHDLDLELKLIFLCAILASDSVSPVNNTVFHAEMYVLGCKYTKKKKRTMECNSMAILKT